MAATNNLDLNKIKEIATQRAQAFTNNIIPNGQQLKTQTPYMGLNGVSGATQQQLGKYTNGYTPSETVTQAQNYLNSVVSGKPGAYQNNYKQQLDDLYSQVMNRPKFSYDLGSDMLYQQYRDQYMNLGQQAMMDTTAQAAALTGGYGNSYAATAGNQAYQAYLQQLNNIVPDLYRMAMERYQQEGEDLNNRYALTADLEGRDYSRYQDDYNRWQAERDYANSEYWNQYGADYGQYGDMRDMWMQLAGQENSQFNADRQLAYNQAMAILANGKMPSSDLLEMAGISSADAKKLKASRGSSGGGGSSRSSGGGSGSGSGSGSVQSNEEADRAAVVVAQSALSQDLKRGMTNTEALDTLQRYIEHGGLTEAEANKIANRLGL